MIQLAVQNVDGSRYTGRRYRLVHVQVVINSAAGTSVVKLDQLVPDTGIINTYYTPSAADEFITVRVGMTSQ